MAIDNTTAATPTQIPVMETTAKRPTEASADNDRLTAAVKGAASRRESERKQSPRERESNLGGMGLKLDVNGRIDGFHMYWANDEDGAIETLLYAGFDFVDPDEVRMRSVIVQDSDLGNRISRYVGKKADGSPLRAYLLKCPDDIWAERENARYRQADAWDSDIRSGSQHTGDGRYKPKGVQTNLNTQFKEQH